MTSPAREEIIICPNCGLIYIDWYRPSINFNLDQFDEDYLDAASSATCPECKFKVYFSQLTVKDNTFIFEGHAETNAAPQPPPKPWVKDDDALREAAKDLDFEQRYRLELMIYEFYQEKVERSLREQERLWQERR